MRAAATNPPATATRRAFIRRDSGVNNQPHPAQSSTISPGAPHTPQGPRPTSATYYRQGTAARAVPPSPPTTGCCRVRSERSAGLRKRRFLDTGLVNGGSSGMPDDPTQPSPTAEELAGTIFEGVGDYRDAKADDVVIDIYQDRPCPAAKRRGDGRPVAAGGPRGRTRPTSLAVVPGTRQFAQRRLVLHVQEDQEEEGAHAPLEGQPRQAPQHG